MLRFLRSVTRGWDAGPGRGAPPRRRLFCFGCPGIASAQGVRSCCMPALSGTRSRWGGPWGRDPRGTPHAALPYVFEAGAEPAAVPFALAGLEGSDPSPSLKGRAERSEPRPATPSRVGAGGEKRWGGGGSRGGSLRIPLSPEGALPVRRPPGGEGRWVPPLPLPAPGMALEKGAGSRPVGSQKPKSLFFTPESFLHGAAGSGAELRRCPKLGSPRRGWGSADTPHPPPPRMAEPGRGGVERNPLSGWEGGGKTGVLGVVQGRSNRSRR